jgi:hypothetical protein
MITGRIRVGAWSYFAAAFVFAPILVVDSLLAAVPFLVVSGVLLMAPIAPLEAARLDVVHPQLRGRAEGARTLARVLAEATAPLAFGVLADTIAGGGTTGLRIAFLLFLPFLGLRSLLLLAAEREYPREVAAVQESIVQTGTQG